MLTWTGCRSGFPTTTAWRLASSPSKSSRRRWKGTFTQLEWNTRNVERACCPQWVVVGTVRSPRTMLGPHKATFFDHDATSSQEEEIYDDHDPETTNRNTMDSSSSKNTQPALGLIRKNKDHGHLTDVPLASPARMASDILIGINVCIFCLQLFFPETITGSGMKINALIDQGEYYRLLTAAFLHGSPSHLLLNMLSLHSLGSICEWTCGKERFLTMYMISAIMGNVSSYYGTPEGASLGASGAIFGLAGALIVYFARNKVIFKDKEIPKSLVLRLVGTVGLNFMIGSLLPNIDEYGHLGGLVSGMVLAYLLGPAYELCYIQGRDGIWLVDNPLVPLVRDTPHLVYLDPNDHRHN